MKLSEYFQTFTCVKSIVTIALTACFIFLCITGQVSTENFMTIYVMIIGFYFGTQWQKRNNKEDNETETTKTRKAILNSAYGTTTQYIDTDTIKELEHDKN